MENLIEGSDTEQLVTFPDDDTDESTLGVRSGPCTEINGTQICSVGGTAGIVGETVKFEETHTSSASKCKVITDGFSSEQAISNSSGMKHLQAGDVDYKEETAAAAVRKKIEVDGVTAEQNAAAVQVRSRTWVVRSAVFDSDLSLAPQFT